MLLLSDIIGFIAIISSAFPLIVIGVNKKRFRLIPKPFVALALVLFVINYFSLYLLLNNVSDQTLFYQFSNVIEIIVYYGLFYFLADIKRKYLLRLQLILFVVSAIEYWLFNFDFEFITSLYLKIMQLGLGLVILSKINLSNSIHSMSNYSYNYFLTGLIIFSCSTIYTTIYERIIVSDENNLYAILWFLPQITGFLFHVLISINIWKIVRQ